MHIPDLTTWLKHLPGVSNLKSTVLWLAWCLHSCEASVKNSQTSVSVSLQVCQEWFWVLSYMTQCRLHSLWLLRALSCRIYCNTVTNNRWWLSERVTTVLGLYRISAPAGILNFIQIRQKSGSCKNPPEPIVLSDLKVDFSQTLDILRLECLIDFSLSEIKLLM